VSFREFNEWIKASNERVGNHRPYHEYICECSDTDCRQPIELDDREYEDIRADGARFVIAPDHENPELDQVIRENARFSTIERLPGKLARLARSRDPRLEPSLKP
jgi:hypothetical protein